MSPDLVSDLAREMFQRQALTYGGEELAEMAWVTDAGIRHFWMVEAHAVLTWLAEHEAAA